MKRDSNKEACKRCKGLFLRKTKWQDFCTSRCRMLAYWTKELEADGYKVEKVSE